MNGGALLRLDRWLLELKEKDPFRFNLLVLGLGALLAALAFLVVLVLENLSRGPALRLF